MLVSIIIAFLLLIVAVIVYREYRNEKNYEASRKKRQSPPIQQKRPQKTPQPFQIPKEHAKAPEAHRAKKKIEQNDHIEKEITKRKEPVPVSKTGGKQPSEKIKLPKCKYPPFSHERLIKMGFPLSEANEYVQELITQIEGQMDHLEHAINAKDFKTIEQITHDIKGSSSTIGSGGISDLIQDFNHSVQTQHNIDISKAYFRHMQHYYKDLKKQYAV